ncbi:trp operon leader peptide [Citrobacter sp. Cpa228]|nr:trp operon leader peptide [Citrobacter sp. 210820-DFI.7.8]MCB6785983.1 trp operon leader peptide [Citrobacter sp. 210820-DFI.7.7]MCB8600653.1 trp operon leader peptide [Citrobacter europaeus]
MKTTFFLHGWWRTS